MFAELDPSEWATWATIIGGIATAFTAAFAVVGIPLVLFQIKEMRKIQRESTAKSLYRQYLEDAISRPDLVTPNLEKLKSDGRIVQYELFVAHMLYSVEEILDNTDGREWEGVAKGQLIRHVEYLKSDSFTPKRDYYSGELLRLLDSI